MLYKYYRYIISDILAGNRPKFACYPCDKWEKRPQLKQSMSYMALIYKYHDTVYFLNLKMHKTCFVFFFSSFENKLFGHWKISLLKDFMEINRQTISSSFVCLNTLKEFIDNRTCKLSFSRQKVALLACDCGVCVCVFMIVAPACFCHPQSAV